MLEQSNDEARRRQMSREKSARYRVRHGISQPVTVPELPGEEWRSVVGYECFYEVSNLARVRRIARGHGARAGSIRRDQPTTQGYRGLVLYKDRIAQPFGVHQIVCAAFHPRPAYPCEVNHKDGVPTNNRADNLEWATKSENNIHAFKILGRKSVGSSGEGNGNSKLTAEKIAAIRATKGLSQVALAKRFGVHQTTISRILLRQTWD